MSSFTASAAASVSSGAESALSEVKRVHVGMRPGDWIYPDCGGFVWSSKPACESDKCQCRYQPKVVSKAECHESSVFYTIPVATERARLRDTHVANQHGELRGISVISGDLEDTGWNTEISPVAVYTRSGDQAEFKRARGVRDPAYQRQPSSGLDTAVKSTTSVWGDV